MCRFVLYVGEPISMATLVTEPTNSLIRQSFQAKHRVEPLNGDGFGVAWYQPEIDTSPALFKSVTPAWNNRNLLHIARITKSPCILAHVRAATSTNTVSELNCHPFAWREFSFCHNGDIGGFRNIRRRLIADLSDEAFSLIQGGTDSEHVFAVFVDEISRSKIEDPCRAMAQSLMAAMRRVVALSRETSNEEHCYMNFAVTDGRRAAVSHCSTDPEYHDSLYIHTGGHITTIAGKTCALKRPNQPPSSVLVSSEPLSDDSGWRTVGLNELVTIDTDLSTTLYPVFF